MNARTSSTWAGVVSLALVLGAVLGVLALLPADHRGAFVGAAAPTVAAAAGAVWNYLHGRATQDAAQRAADAASTAVEQTNGTLDARIQAAVTRALAARDTP